MQARGLLNYRLYIAGWKLSAVYANQTNLNVNFSTQLGGQKSGVYGSQPPLESPLGIQSSIYFIKYTRFETKAVAVYSM